MYNFIRLIILTFSGEYERKAYRERVYIYPIICEAEFQLPGFLHFRGIRSISSKVQSRSVMEARAICDQSYIVSYKLEMDFTTATTKKVYRNTIRYTWRLRARDGEEMKVFARWASEKSEGLLLGKPPELSLRSNYLWRCEIKEFRPVWKAEAISGPPIPATLAAAASTHAVLLSRSHLSSHVYTASYRRPNTCFLRRKILFLRLTIGKRRNRNFPRNYSLHRRISRIFGPVVPQTRIY